MVGNGRDDVLRRRLQKEAEITSLRTRLGQVKEKMTEAASVRARCYQEYEDEENPLAKLHLNLEYQVGRCDSTSCRQHPDHSLGPQQ